MTARMSLDGPRTLGTGVGEKRPVELTTVVAAVEEMRSRTRSHAARPARDSRGAIYRRPPPRGRPTSATEQRFSKGHIDRAARTSRY
ncbi:hypothetical protein [Streptomyces sp900116325]|uniref:hypothetical protein n=1 Tax=Streptomyces sp. 900116325 TaxID=3154295 RepID=UPI00339FD68C